VNKDRSVGDATFITEPFCSFCTHRTRDLNKSLRYTGLCVNESLASTGYISPWQLALPNFSPLIQCLTVVFQYLKMLREVGPDERYVGVANLQQPPMLMRGDPDIIEMHTN